MKKLMGISVIAMLAVAAGFSAHAANGDPVPGAPTAYSGNDATTVTASVEPEFALVGSNEATDGNAASAGYVKGAYNAAIKAINKVNANTKTEAGDGLTKTNNTISVDLATNSGLEISGGKLKVDAADGSIALGANGASVALTADKGLTKDSQAGTLEVQAGNGIELGSGGVAVKSADSSVTVNASGVAVHVDGSTVEVNSTNGVQVKDSGITTAKIADSNVTTAKLAADAVTNAKLADDAVQTENIVNGNVTLAKIASGAIQNGSAQNAANDKLTTKDYVDESIAGLATDYATKTGVDNTITALGVSSTVNDDFTLANGAVTGAGTVAIMTDWSNPNTATTLQVLPGTFAVATGITEGTVTTTLSKSTYATANSGS